MKHHKLKIEQHETMKYVMIYKDALVRAELKEETRKLEKSDTESALKTLEQQKETSLTSDSIIVQADETLFSTPKLIHKKRSNENEKAVKFAVKDTKMTEITDQLQALTLAVNTFSNSVKQQAQIQTQTASVSTILQRLLAASFYSSRASSVFCYVCGNLDHETMRCLELDLLCEKDVIH